MAKPQPLTELEIIRRDRDWSYQELADEIARVTQKRRDQDCWRKICQGLTDRPHSRTQDILDKFLAALDGESQPRRRVSA
jgi:hypothetical protein